jgi:hypothetical protein
MMEYIVTFCRGREIDLLWKPGPEEIQARLAEGFVPIEMAEGQESVVDFHCLDHHNAYSHLPSACITALRYYGTLASPVKLMVNHTDADCVLTGLTLSGLLPLDVLQKLNEEVGLVDTEPLGVDYSRLVYGDLIQLWKAGMTSVKQSGWSWLYGLQLFLDLFDNDAAFSDMKLRQREREEERMRLAFEDYENAMRGPSGKTLLISPSRVHGFDVQFVRDAGHPADSLKGWRHWCIVAYVQTQRSVTLSCPNSAVAELVFGQGGLMNVYSKLPSLEGKDWGGRESVGGSPRGVPFPEELLPDVLKTVDGAMTAK